MNLPQFLTPDEDLSLVITIIVFAWATWQVWRGALLGARGHARPRLWVAVALTAGLVLNVAALAHLIGPEARGQIARGVTWVLVVALGFTAMTGVKYGKKVEHAAGVVENLAEQADRQFRDDKNDDKE